MAGVIDQVKSGVKSLMNKSPLYSSTQNSQMDESDSSVIVADDTDTSFVTPIASISATTPIVQSTGLPSPSVSPMLPKSSEIRKELFKQGESDTNVGGSPKSDHKFAGEVEGLEAINNASVSDKTAVHEADKEDPVSSCGVCQDVDTDYMLSCSECRKLYHYACTKLPPFQINIFKTKNRKFTSGFPLGFVPGASAQILSASGIARPRVYA